MRVTSGSRGFSLVEVTVAAAVLLLTCVSIGGLLAGVLAAERATARRDALEAAVDRECERLVVLPFAASPDAVIVAASSPGPTSAVDELFPHAEVARSTEAAYYCDGSGDGVPGSFVTEVRNGDVVVRRASRFVSRSPNGYAVLSPAVLTGWPGAAGGDLPAAALAVTLSASADGVLVERRLLLVALPAGAAS